MHKITVSKLLSATKKMDKIGHGCCPSGLLDRLKRYENCDMSCDNCWAKAISRVTRKKFKLNENTTFKEGIRFLVRYGALNSDEKIRVCPLDLFPETDKISCSDYSSCEECYKDICEEFGMGDMKIEL